MIKIGTDSMSFDVSIYCGVHLIDLFLKKIRELWSLRFHGRSEQIVFDRERLRMQIYFFSLNNIIYELHIYLWQSNETHHFEAFELV